MAGPNLLEEEAVSLALRLERNWASAGRGGEAKEASWATEESVLA